MKPDIQDSWDNEEFGEPAFSIEEDDLSLSLVERDLELEELEELNLDIADGDADAGSAFAQEDIADGVPISHDMSDAAGMQPIPRIRVLASTDRSETAAILRQVAGDRRLARAEFAMETGGIDAAIGYCATNPSPDLLLLDTTASPRELLEKLDRLAAHVDEGTKVLIIGASNDIGLFRELMRRGVSEYLVPPVQPLTVIRTIATLYANPEKPFAGRVVATIGAKGGVGASTVAHNVAWLLAERFLSNTTIVDLDLPFGTTALDFNQEPQQTVAEALLTPERLDEVFLDRSLTRQTDRLMLLCAPGSMERDIEVGPEAYEQVVDAVRRTTPFVVLDLPHIWTPWVRDALVAADDIVIVATPELASLRNAKNMLDRIKAARALDATPSLVLNMVGVPKRPEIPVKDFGEAIGLQPTIVLPFEPQVFGNAANNGQMIPEIAPQSKIADALEALTTSLSGREPPARKKTSVLDRIPLLKR